MESNGQKMCGPQGAGSKGPFKGGGPEDEGSTSMAAEGAEEKTQTSSDQSQPEDEKWGVAWLTPLPGFSPRLHLHLSCLQIQ